MDWDIKVVYASQILLGDDSLSDFLYFLEGFPQHQRWRTRRNFGSTTNPSFHNFKCRTQAVELKNLFIVLLSCPPKFSSHFPTLIFKVCCTNLRGDHARFKNAGLAA